MRIIQLIDSLEAGGAERMAVNFANGLASKADFSGLVCTRKEGLLKDQMLSEVEYLFLSKKSALDVAALFRLRNFCVKNQVTHVQAHATSFFTAFLLRLMLPKLKIIWHDHYGLSEFLSQRRPQLLWLCSNFFDGIIAVNEPLKHWSLKHLTCKKVIYLPNFVSTTSSIESQTSLAGVAEKRILCLANLRAQKNHFMLLSVAELLQQSHPEWTFHLVGQDFNDAYSAQLKHRILDAKLEEHVFLYGSRADTAAIIQQTTIGLLTSDSEGLPLAVLEYGLFGLPVVVTQVGEIPAVVTHQHEGFVVPAGSFEMVYKSLVELIENQNLRLKFGQALQTKVQHHYSAESVLSTFNTWCNTI